MTDTDISDLLDNKIIELERALAVSLSDVERLSNDYNSLIKESSTLRKDSEVHELAAVCVQNLVDTVSKNSIEKVENLVNSALRTIFFDQDIEFKIISEVKRNLTCYRIVTKKDGVEGSINSFAGGVMAVEAMVMKVLFNLLAKRFPFIVLDESLSFVSEKYIQNTSDFMKDLSKQFNLPIVLVTHQPSFEEGADTKIHVFKKDGKTSCQLRD